MKRLIGLEHFSLGKEGEWTDMKIFTMSFVPLLLLLASNCFLGWLHFFVSHMIQFHVVLSEFPLFNNF